MLKLRYCPIGLYPYKRINLDIETDTQKKCHGEIGVMLPQIKNCQETRDQPETNPPLVPLKGA